MAENQEDMASLLNRLDDFELFPSPPKSDSGSSSTASADSARVLVTPATEEQKEVLDHQRYLLSWKQFVALQRKCESTEVIMKYGTTREEKTQAATRAKMASLACLDMKNTVNENLLVQKYNKANPLQNMDHITLHDASKMIFLVAEAPTGRTHNDIYKELMDRLLPKWKPKVQELDEWDPDKKILKDLEKRFKAQQNYTRWVQKTYREESNFVKEALAKQKSADERLREFKKRMDILTEKVNQERELKLAKANRLRHAYDEEERKSIEIYYEEALKKCGVGGAAGVGSVPKRVGGKNVKP